jgi:flagellar hook-associated protein 1 FlgK
VPGLFGIYNLAAQSLLSYQTAINTVGHNVANAATDGFHRQRVELKANLPARTGFGPLGMGVGIGSIHRIEDTFIEFAIQREIPILSRYSARSDALEQSQLAFGEPSDAGLTTILDEFFGGWNDLASSPEDAGARESVVRLGISLADSVKNARNRLVVQQESITSEIARAVDEVNRLATELEHLNQNILASTRDGLVPADLEDRRDVIIQSLGDLIGGTARIEDNGTATVHVGGRLLVQLETADLLDFDLARSDVPFLAGRELRPENLDGRIGGLMQVRDEDIAGSIRRLDEFALRLAEDVNRVHRQGIDSYGNPADDFFHLPVLDPDGVGQAAASIAVNPSLVADSLQVAAGTAGEEGDNVVALDIASLRNDVGGASSMLRSLVVDLGARARESEDLAQGQSIVVESFRAQRESVSGVSLDEEAAHLMRFQRSYEAAARIMTLVDEMTQTLLSV